MMKALLCLTIAIVVHGSVAFSTVPRFPSRVRAGRSIHKSSWLHLSILDGGRTRRDVIQEGLLIPALSWTLGANRASAANEEPLADLPMRRLRLPRNALGRDYVVIQLKIKGEGPFDFMVDSGLTTEMITPHLQEQLKIGSGGRKVLRGLSAGGDRSGSSLVDLVGASLCCGEFAGRDKDELPLPKLHAIVTDFPQEHLDPAHDPVEGMLGMELLDMFDVDLDFPSGRFRLWSPGMAAKAADTKDLVDIPAAVLNESGLLGIRITTEGGKQPIVGVIDCGASFSIVNWAGAELLGLPSKTDKKAYAKGPAVMAVGIDGKPQPFPTKDVRLTYSGDVSKVRDQVNFAAPPKSWKPWDSVQMGVGDLAVFPNLLGDGITPFKGPAAIIGLDILSQRRVILETGNGRRRRLLVSSS